MEVVVQLWHIHEAEVLHLKMTKATYDVRAAACSVQGHAYITLLA